MIMSSVVAALLISYVDDRFFFKLTSQTNGGQIAKNQEVGNYGLLSSPYMK
jgi:hypothetical protein